MAAGHVFIATSLDGYIARLDGGLDWLSAQDNSEEDHGFEDFLEGMDGIVMGRETFQTVLGFGEWPYAMPVVVLSRTLTPADIPEAMKDRVVVSGSDPAVLMAALDGEGWRRVYVDGGQTIRSFLAEGLIAEMTITRVPVLLGEGRPLFGPTAGDVALSHVQTRAFHSGLVQSRYRVG